MKGTIKEIREGEFTVEETVAVLASADGDKNLRMMQEWPVRRGRPYQKKLPPTMPLVTGQRVVDTFFSDRKGRCRSSSGTIWQWKDGDTASACEMGGSRYRGLHWMR